MTVDTRGEGPTPAVEDLPRIISVDDHILEPRTLWQDELPAAVRERGPRVSRQFSWARAWRNKEYRSVTGLMLFLAVLGIHAFWR